MEVFDSFYRTTNLHINVTVKTTYLSIVKTNDLTMYALFNIPTVISTTIQNITITIYLGTISSLHWIMLRAFSIFHAWTSEIIQTAGTVHHVFSNRSIKLRLFNQIWNLSAYNSIYKVTIVDFIFQPKKNVSMRKTTLLKLNSIIKCNCLSQHILFGDFVHQRS